MLDFKTGKSALLAFVGLFLLAGGIMAGVLIVMRPQLFGQKAAVQYTIIPSCNHLDCSDSGASGVITCLKSDNVTTTHCCPYGKTAVNGFCVDTNTGTINCGGVQCSPNNCHCTGGDACTGYECYSDTQIAN